VKDTLHFVGRIWVEHWRKEKLLYSSKEPTKNKVVNEGLQHMIDILFNSGSQEATWYVGLMAATPVVAAGDLMSSHGGWTEFTAYTGDRKLYDGSRSSQTQSNSASLAEFTINADTQTVGGAFINSDETGTAGILLCGAAFTGGNRTGLMTSDVIRIRYDITAASAV
jgi:hypothetical protein